MKKTNQQDLLRAIPKVDEFLLWVTAETNSSDPNIQPPARGELIDNAPLGQIKKAVRQVLAEKRAQILSSSLVNSDDLLQEVLLADFCRVLEENLQPNFRTVINATGVVVHTNLGRSILPGSAMESLLQVGKNYSNLEFDLKTGSRGSRYSLVEDLLCELTGAQAALVVNNNAAAVLLVLGTLAQGREVIVSRGQLVEIGGSFRIPDVMLKSGVQLVEVGATNRTHLHDYENAITENTGLLLKVHTSNFRIIGFTSEVPLSELANLGTKRQIPVMEDLGSGCLVDLSRFGLEKEPTVKETVASGADIITFSGDKLLGGPQAGLIVGKKDIIEKIKKNPLNRALRVDKFTLAGLESILRMYFDEESALKNIPTLAMLSMPVKDIERRAARLLKLVKGKLADHCMVSTMKSESRVGGGAMPEQGLLTRVLAVKPLSLTVNQLEERLRMQSPPVIGRIENDCFFLDMRTVLDSQVRQLAESLCGVFHATP